MGKLFSQTYVALRQEILSGSLASGEGLVEQALADRFAVSRTPIREAIRQLQQEGLIESDQRGGLRVSIITIADAVHLYDCRIGLEQVAVVGACENATARQIEDLQDCLAQANLSSPTAADKSADKSALLNSQMSHQASLQASDHTAELENRLMIDQSFHRLLADSSGNPWLADLLDQIFSKMALLRLTTTYRNPDVLEIWAEHERIVSAIVQRDAQAAAAAVRDHLLASKARVVDELQGLQVDAPLRSVRI
ncbi:MAG: GntR family transcriptional regulator [Phormidesmis sp.]